MEGYVASKSHRQPLEVKKGKETDTPLDHHEGPIGLAKILILAWYDPLWISDFQNWKTLSLYCLEETWG